MDEEFWSKVDTINGPTLSGLTRCWIWTGAIDRHGYGSLGRRVVGRNRWLKANRYAVEQVNGVEPPLGIYHHCDNPPCVRPSHLFTGTQADNLKDMTVKGRRRHGVTRGGQHPRPQAKLTESQVREIRQKYVPGAIGGGDRGNGALLAYEYGVSGTTIFMVATGRSWKHLLEVDK